MESHFLAYLYRLRHIERWSLMRNTTRENVAEHSYHVALLTHLLCEIGNRVFGRRLNADRAAAMALFHDATEVFTGDIPTPVKHHNPRMLDSFREIEALAAERLAAMVPEPLKEAYAPLLRGKAWQRNEADTERVEANPSEADIEDLQGNVGAAEKSVDTGNGGYSGGGYLGGEYPDGGYPGDEYPGAGNQGDEIRSGASERHNHAIIRGMQNGDERNSHGQTSAAADDPDAELRKYLKAADLLDAYLKCTVELASGNREFAVAHRQIKASLDRLALPEAEWFLEHFAPSFGKTLDELSGDA